MSKWDPRRAHDVWPPYCDDAPENSRPVFEYRRLAEDEYERVSDALDGSAKPSGDADGGDRQWAEQYRQGVYEAALIGLLGVRNQIDVKTGEPVTEVKSADDLRRILNIREVIQLVNRRLQGGRLDAAEKKGSTSPN
jgi:hypothetical protein